MIGNLAHKLGQYCLENLKLMVSVIYKTILLFLCILVPSVLVLLYIGLPLITAVASWHLLSTIISSKFMAWSGAITITLIIHFLIISPPMCWLIKKTVGWLDKHM